MVTGKVSDKHLTEHCGLLSKLLPGDTILADHGINITHLYKRKKKQLSGIEVEQTHRIANVKIHVERVIGNI